MFTKISVLVPTRKRLSRLMTMMRSYEATSEGSTSELVYRVDDDDVETRDFLSGKMVVTGPRLNGYASLPVFFNEMLGITTGDVFMCGNDDMIFRTPGWAPLILEEANKYADGIFDLGVHTHNETHFPFATVSKKVVDALGFIWDPRIFWGDIFLRDVMGAFGRTVYVPHVHIDHDWIGHAPDAVFLEGDQNDIYRRDPEYWTVTHPTAVAAAVTRLREVL